MDGYLLETNKMGSINKNNKNNESNGFRSNLEFN